MIGKLRVESGQRPRHPRARAATPAISLPVTSMASRPYSADPRPAAD
jgi:hypothetical protein